MMCLQENVQIIEVAKMLIDAMPRDLSQFHK